MALGIPDGMLGPAWPAMRHTFGSPVGALGFVLLLNTAGSVAMTVVVGRLIRRLGVAGVLTASGGCAAVAAAGFAAAPGFATVLGVAVLWGVAAGLMDGGLNTAIGLSGRPRLLNLLHGAYGIGTVVGPLLVTVAVLVGSWRAAYVVLCAIDVAVAGLWLLARRREPGHRPAPEAGSGPVAAPHVSGADPAGTEAEAGAPSAAGQVVHPFAGRSRRAQRLAITTGIAAFFVYTGLEVAAGQWEASFCRGHLHLGATAAGLATFGYWAALTVVRVSLAVTPRPVGPRLVVAVGSVVALAATAAVWVQPGTAATLAAFVVLGAALAGMFPSLVALTPERLGRRRAEHVIAWQVGGAAAGGAALSAAIGGLIGGFGLGVLGPALTLLAVVLAATLGALEWAAPSRPAA